MNDFLLRFTFGSVSRDLIEAKTPCFTPNKMLNSNLPSCEFVLTAYRQAGAVCALNWVKLSWNKKSRNHRGTPWQKSLGVLHCSRGCRADFI